MEKKVLIVDDSFTNNFLQQSILDSKGIKSSIAINGQEALSLLKNEIPTLNLLDIMMPELDGYDVLEKTKNNPSKANIPIVFITAHDNDNLIQKALKFGAIDLIQKLFDVKTVIQLVKTLLN